MKIELKIDHETWEKLKNLLATPEVNAVTTYGPFKFKLFDTAVTTHGMSSVLIDGLTPEELSIIGSALALINRKP